MEPKASRSESHESLDSPTSSTAAPIAKRRRTSASSLSGCCRTCRMRKVKCGGNPGSGQPCSNCARLELRCDFIEDEDAASSNKKTERISRTAPTSSHTEAGTLRKRAQRACKECHLQKTKCSGDLPSCKRCVNNHLQCEYTPAKRKFASIQAAPRADAESSKRLPAKGLKAKAHEVAPPKKTENFPLLLDVSVLTYQELIRRQNILLEHLDAYFENLYWLPGMGLFHPTKTRIAILHGTLDTATATAMCAVSSFFVDSSEAGREFGRKCCDEVEFFLFRNIHKFSEEILLVCALILSYDFVAGAFAKVWQCLGLAARGMLGLQLNWDFKNPSKTFEQQETGRRIAWQVFVMDRLLAGGYDEYISIRAEVMKIRLPCEEAAFWDDRRVIAERLREKTPKCRGIGIHGLLTRLVDLYHRIQVWNTKLLAKGSFEPSKIMEEINAFQSELAAFSAAMPEDMKLSDQSIAKYMPSAERVGYVYLQTRLRVAHIELYRFALPGIIDPMKNDIVRKLPLDFAEACKKQAVAHALCTGRFFMAIVDEVAKHPSQGKLNLVADCTSAYMSTQCLRVLLIAIEHGIYENLNEQTTAPLWRFQHPDEAYIRNMIRDGFFKVSEPWGEVLTMIKQVHATNIKVLADFDRTRKFAENKTTLDFSQPQSEVPTRLPGPHFILENAHNSVAEQEMRLRAADAATADRWSRHAPHQQQQPSEARPPQDSYSESEVDSDFGPPGVPLTLAAARTFNIDPEVGGPQGFYNPQQQALALQQNLWLADPLAAPSDTTVHWMGAVSTPASVPVLHGMPTANVVYPSPQSSSQYMQVPELLGSQPMFLNGFPAYSSGVSQNQQPYPQDTHQRIFS